MKSVNAAVLAVTFVLGSTTGIWAHPGTDHKTEMKHEGSETTCTCAKDGHASEKHDECAACAKAMEETSGKKGTKKSGVEVAKYHCSMDGYESDKPGRCAKCGMNLEKKTMKSSDVKDCKVGQSC